VAFVFVKVGTVCARTLEISSEISLELFLLAKIALKLFRSRAFDICIGLDSWELFWSRRRFVCMELFGAGVLFLQRRWRLTPERASLRHQGG
jgi:hypothetical protein